MQPLLEKINRREAKVGIIGLGYVGLPLAVEFALAGFNVRGIDIDRQKVASVNAGRSYIIDVPTEQLSRLVKQGKLYATTDFGIITELDTLNICVPTPLGKSRDPDVSYIVAAVAEIAKYLRKGQLIVLESTTYPGATEELVLAKLEESDLRVGEDFYLAFSPERVDPGNKVYTTRNVPKVVGGMTPRCTRLATALYEQCISEVKAVSSTRVAEMVKLLENTFRSVNIGLVNEIALMSDKLGIDVWEVIEAAATKPFGFMPFYPGPGLGGHCIPVDPFYLSWKARSIGFEARFIELAGMVNSFMPYHVVNKIADALNRQTKCLKGSKILILGVAYKKDIDDVRESPALDIINMLSEKEAKISYADPYVPTLALTSYTLTSQELEESLLASQDCVVIITAHSNIDYSLVVKHAPLIVDTRNALKGFSGEHIVKL
jgi:UDP-N-acetyl-D-glucosamine dehydrogenase